MAEVDPKEIGTKIDAIKTRWAGLGLWLKILVIIGLPVLALFFAPQMNDLIRHWLDERKRKETDQKAQDLVMKDQAIEKSEEAQATEIAQTEAAKKAAQEEATHETPTDFFNHRDTPTP